MSPWTSWRAGLHATPPSASARAARRIAWRAARRIEAADGGSIRPALRSLLLAVAASALGGAVVFLLVSDVLGTWNGQAVSVRPSPAEGSDTRVVRILEPSGRLLERRWPAEVVRDLHLPADDLALAPTTPPDTAAPTSKDRFDLHF